jgi:hypothetical protein
LDKVLPVQKIVDELYLINRKEVNNVWHQSKDITVWW